MMFQSFSVTEYQWFKEDNVMEQGGLYAHRNLVISTTIYIVHYTVERTLVLSAV